MKKTFKDTQGRTIINKSKIEFCKDNEYYKKNYNCELCGTEHHFSEMSTCERCLRFVCDECSEAVINRENNPYTEWEFLCDECKEELDKQRRAERKEHMRTLHKIGKLQRKYQ